MSGNRQFFQTANDSRNVMSEILQLIFSAELVSPSRCVWIVSPWLRDIPILDNSTGAYISVCPEFPQTQIALSKVVAVLIDRGTQVVIATRPDGGNRQVLDGVPLETRSDQLVFHERAELHAKGIIGDRFALSGSMNLTFNGLERLTEMVSYQTDRNEVEALRLTFRAEYGGRA
jgi:phosphatidylserine/phosphatidylglycerophosphate/cardiolipin synthase-like enzyme